MMPIILLTLFFVSYFLHITSRFPILGALRLDMLLGVAAFVAVFMQATEDKFRLQVPTSRRLMIFLVYIIISLPFVTWPGSVIRFNLLYWIKAALFFLLVIGSVRSEGHLKWIMYVFLGCQAFRILEPLYLHITQGYWGDIAYSQVGGAMSGLDRLSGAPHDIVNANQYAWVIVNTIPFLFYLFWKGDKIGKLIFMVALPPFVYALMLTGSRSGLVSLAVVVVGIVLISENKMRNLIIALVVVLPGSIFMFAHSDSALQDRYLSIVDSSVAGGDTRQGRIDGLLRQLGTLSNNPLFGNGLGTSMETNANVLSGKPQPTHNLYLEILQESGVIGFGLFMAYIVTMCKALLQARHLLKESGYDESDWLHRIISATLVWVIMDLVYSISCFGISSWEWYFFGGITTVSITLVHKRLEQYKPDYGATV